MFDIFSGIFSLLFWIIGTIIWTVPFFIIYKKLGHNPWLSLLWIFPPAGIISAYYVAFSHRDPDDDLY